jgi:tRNA(Ile)-lysidine synthase
MDMSYAILKGVENSQLINEGDRILVGVSGGVDSVVLLDVLLRLSPKINFKISVGHVNHALRGAESDRDERFVKELAAKRGLKCYSKKLDNLKESGENLQNLARKLRYDFLEKTAKKIKADKIALAHHADDQAETMLQHLIRGSGLAGLCGMKDVRRIPNDMAIIRPLLGFTKDELKEYAKQRRLRFTTDSSNKKGRYTRNALRNDLLPRLKKYNPKIVLNLCKTAAILSDDDLALRNLSQSIFNDNCVKSCHKVIFPKKLFLTASMSVCRRICRLAYEHLTGSTENLLTDHVEKMIQISRSPKKRGEYYLPKSVKFTRKLDKIYMSL